MDAFKVTKKIEADSSKSTVFRADRNDTGKKVVVKKLQLDSEKGVPLTAIREIKALNRLKSSHILELHECFIEQNCIYLIMEHMPFTLAELLLRKFPFTADHFNCIAVQLFKAVEFIHKHGMIHRNLNPTNIMLDSDCNLKLADLSTARTAVHSMTNEVYSLHYRAPELLLGDTQYTNKVDSWSIACILIELKTGTPPFKAEDEIAQCKLILKTLGAPTCEYPWSQIYNVNDYLLQETPESIVHRRYGPLFEEKVFLIIRECLRTNKNTRISVTNVLKLPFLRQASSVNCKISLED